MDKTNEIVEPVADALPGYEVHFYLYRTGCTATIFQVAYKRGRRRLVGRRSMPLPPIAQLGEQGAASDVRILCLQLARVLQGMA